jgi:hypothetical protein
LKNDKVDWRPLRQNIERLLSDMGEVKTQLKAIDAKVTRIDSNVDELNVAVANLTLSNRHLRRGPCDYYLALPDGRA